MRSTFIIPFLGKITDPLREEEVSQWSNVGLEPCLATWLQVSSPCLPYQMPLQVIKGLVSAKLIMLASSFLGKPSSKLPDSWISFSHGFPLSSQHDRRLWTGCYSPGPSMQGSWVPDTRLEARARTWQVPRYGQPQPQQAQRAWHLIGTELNALQTASQAHAHHA